MRPSQTIGVDPLEPGKGTFHAMLSVELHVAGNPSASETPLPVGPRHVGQFPRDSAAIADRNGNKNRTTETTIGLDTFDILINLETDLNIPARLTITESYR